MTVVDADCIGAAIDYAGAAIQLTGAATGDAENQQAQYRKVQERCAQEALADPADQADAEAQEVSRTVGFVTSRGPYWRARAD